MELSGRDAMNYCDVGNAVTGLVVRKQTSTVLCRHLESSATGGRWSSVGPSSAHLPALTRNMMTRWRSISAHSTTCVWQSADVCLLTTIVS